MKLLSIFLLLANPETSFKYFTHISSLGNPEIPSITISPLSEILPKHISSGCSNIMTVDFDVLGSNIRLAPAPQT